MRIKVLFGVALLSLLSGRTVVAHHSTAVNFDSSKEITVSGVLTEIKWMNPHSRFRLSVKNTQGKAEEWLVEMGALNTMKRAGFPLERFVIGDEVKMIGAAGRRDRALLLRESILKDGTHLTPDMRPRTATPGREVSGG